MSSGDVITVRGQSIEAPALDHPIGFEVPLVGLMPRVRPFEYNWHLIQYVFQLPPPSMAQPMPSIDDEERSVLLRFIDAAGQIAESAFMEHDTRVSYSAAGPGDQMEMTAQFPPRDVERGFILLIRHFLEAKEFASFQAAVRILRRQSEHAGMADNVDMIDRWALVEKRLRRRPPALWAAMKVLRVEHGSGRPSGLPGHDHPPVSKLFEIYCYGERIHVGNQRQQLAELEKDEFLSAHHRMTLFKGIAGLATLYTGFASLVSSAIVE